MFPIAVELGNLKNYDALYGMITIQDNEVH
jgi:hypothetical protein